MCRVFHQCACDVRVFGRCETERMPCHRTNRGMVFVPSGFFDVPETWQESDKFCHILHSDVSWVSLHTFLVPPSLSDPIFENWLQEQ